jgi:8-oxo-dGTP diphosphatase
MPLAADDAKNSGLFTFDNLPEQLAFDHAMVLSDYKHYLETGQVAPLRV